MGRVARHRLPTTMVETHTKPMNPKQLVDEFKKSGEFDRLRRQLLTHFASSDDVRPLMSRVEEIVRQKLSQDERLEHKPREAVHSEVMQDMERYPIVERAVTDLDILKDDALLTSIGQYTRNIIRGESNDNTRLWEAKPAHRGQDEEDDNDASSDYTEDEDPEDEDPTATDEKKLATKSQSPTPAPGNSSITDAVSPNGHPIPQSCAQPDSKSAIRSLDPTTQPNIAMSLHAPSWQPDDAAISISSHDAVRSGGSNSHSVAGEPSNDSFVREPLVNDVSLSGDPNQKEEDNSTLRELPPKPEVQTIQSQDDSSVSLQKESEGKVSDSPAHSPEVGNLARGNDLTSENEGHGLHSGSTHLSPSHTPPWT